MVLFPGVSCGESKTEVLEEARKKSQEESRIGFQERNPGEESRRKIQERRGIWNRHTVAGGTGGTGG